jgi:hypothetical protein
MSKRDDLIAKYAGDIETKCEMKPDMNLLTAVTIGCGPSIYNADACTVSAGDPKELERVKKNFLIKKLGLKDSPKLDEGIQEAINTYGKSNRKKYRAVMYYLLVKHFRKASLYK